MCQPQNFDFAPLGRWDGWFEFRFTGRCPMLSYYAPLGQTGFVKKAKSKKIALH